MNGYQKGPPQKPPRPLSPVDTAGPSDLEDLIWFLHDMRTEIADGEVDEEVVVALARTLIERDGGVALIVRGKDKIEASLGLKFEQPLLRRRPQLRVVWNCVSPESRTTTGHAKSLLLRARDIANGLRCTLTVEEFGPDLNPERATGKAKLIARHMTPVGYLFRHVPEVA